MTRRPTHSALLALLSTLVLLGPAGPATAQSQEQPTPPDTRWLSQVDQEIAGSVVAVTSASEFAAGFVVETSRHVVTTFEVVEVGRPIDVHFAGGDVIRASVVAYDREANLALLELEADPPPGVAPLALAEGVVQVGDPVAVAQPVWLSSERSWGELAWFTAPSTVGGVSDGMIVAPAAFQAPWSSRGPVGAFGAPLVTPEGAVVGVVSDEPDEGIVVATPVAAVRALLERSGSGAEGWRGSWDFSIRLGWTFLFELGRVNEDSDVPNGILVGLAVTVRDRFVIELRFSSLFVDTTPNDPGVTSDVQGALGELLFGYRALLTRSSSPVALYLTPRIGASVIQVTRTERRLELADGTLGVVERKDEGDPWFAPTVQLGLGIARIFELGVGFHANVEQFDESAFNLYLGFGF